MGIRKILSKDEIEKRDRKRKIIISVVLVAIMLFSSAGYAFFSNDEKTAAKTEKITYGGIEFIKTDYGTWQFIKNNYQFETKFMPNDTENISAQISKTLDNYYQKPLYFGVNSKADIASAGSNEILRNIYPLIERNDLSCLDENCTEDKPIKDCFVDNVIIFKESNESVIKTEDGCIVLYSSLYEQERTADAFLFKLLEL